MTKEYYKEYYEAHKEELKKQHHEYYLKHKENIIQKNIQWEKEHPDKIKESKRKWNLKHKKEKIELQKKYRKTKIGRAFQLSCAYKQNDNKFNRGESTITAKWIEDNIFSGQKCVYCGEDDWTKLGCDRIDNDKPHTPENCVCCCEECNKKKGTKSYEDFLKLKMG